MCPRIGGESHGQATGQILAPHHGAVPVADGHAGDHQGDVVCVLPPTGFHRKRHVTQGHQIVPHPHLQTHKFLKLKTVSKLFPLPLYKPDLNATLHDREQVIMNVQESLKKNKTGGSTHVHAPPTQFHYLLRFPRRLKALTAHTTPPLT